MPDLSVLFAVADQIPAMLAYWDASRRCQFANQAHQTWFDLAPDQIVGLDIVEFLGPLYAVSRPHIEAALAGQSQRFERDVPGRGGGRSRRVQTNYIPDVSHGAVRGFSVLVIDLSHTDAGTRLAHEINSPLASMFANLERTGEALGDALVDPALWRPMLADIGAAAARIGELVRNVAGLPPLPRAAHAAAASAPRRRKLVVVDDDRALARSLERLLAADYDVTVIGDPRAAVARLTADDPAAELVLCDVVMPDLTGLDVRRAVAAVHPELADRFVFMTGGAPDALWRAVASEPVPVIEKPFAVAALRRLLASR